MFTFTDKLRAIGAEAGVDYDSYDSFLTFALAVGARRAARDSQRIALTVMARGKAVRA